MFENTDALNHSVIHTEDGIFYDILLHSMKL